MENTLKKEAVKLHRETLVADLHCDTIIQMKRGYDFTRRHKDYHVDIPRLQEGGVDLQVFAASIIPSNPPDMPREKIIADLGFLQKKIAENPDTVSICLTAGEAESARAAGLIGVLLAVESGDALDNDPVNIDYFYERGVRLITVVHERSTGWGISWSDKNPAFDSFNDLGRAMIARMNELGVIVDVSHCSRATFDGVLGAARAPVIASHSCVDALCHNGRNLTDDQIKEIANSGGLVGITFVSFFLSEEMGRASKEFWEQYPEESKIMPQLFLSELDEDEKKKRYERYKPLVEKFEKYIASVRPTVSTVVDHIDHAVKLVGVDFVGLGSDYDGMTFPPLGLEDCSGMPHITEELFHRGYAETEIRKILGGNFMRVFKQVCG
ncbi:MAG: dipeptidase [candidate division Zixibacteria bacterium]|nr:dipeptidase [candidate division Zixibacteria bacterium]